MCSHTVRAPLGRNIQRFCSFHSAGPLNTSKKQTKKKKEKRVSSSRSTQTTLNIMVPGFNEHSAIAPPVTPAWRLARHWAAVICSADGGQRLSKTAPDGGICSGSLRCPNCDWQDWILRTRFVLPKQIVASKFSLPQSETGAGSCQSMTALKRFYRGSIK